MRGHGARFNQLDKRVAGGNWAFMTKVGNECPSIALHMDDIVAQFYDKFPDFCPGRNGLEVTSIEIKDEFLTK